MANKQWPRWVAAVAALAMAGSLPGTALAAPAQGDTLLDANYQYHA